MGGVIRRSLDAAGDLLAVRRAVLEAARAGGLAPAPRCALVLAVSAAAGSLRGTGRVALEAAPGRFRLTVEGPREALRPAVERCSRWVPEVRFDEGGGGIARIELEHPLPRGDDPAVAAAVEGLADRGADPTSASDAGREPTSEPGAATLAWLDRTDREVEALLDDLGRRRSDLQRLDAELEETNRGVVALYAELDERDRRKNEFLATLAHELRNPLGVVRSALEALGSGGTEETSGEEAGNADLGSVARPVELAERQIRHLARLVDDLLDVSRIDQGKIPLHLRRVDLAQVVAQAVESGRHLLDRRGHRLEMDLGDAPLPVEADPVRLEQVVLNLLSNAAKYTPEGGWVAVRARRHRRRLQLEVEDDGVGIPDHQLRRIFQSFTQVDTTLDRAGGGLGLGLALVDRLVRLHGGVVTAHSGGPGRGSRFVVDLPLAEGEAQAGEARAEETLAEGTGAEGTRSREAPDGEAPDGGGSAAPDRSRGGGTGAAEGSGSGPGRSEGDVGERPVLLVEDNDDAREMLALLLEGRGFPVVTAEDGEEGVRRGTGGDFRAAVVDIGLPGLDGYEVARRLRGHRGSAGMLLIALSGYGRPEDRERSAEAGFDHHLVKPVEPNELCRLLGAGG